MIDPLIALRHELHRYPELSGLEQETAGRIHAFLRPLKPGQLLTMVGGHGVVAIFDSGRPGPEVWFRADMDALPVNETTHLDYASENPGVSHKCGHDGHTAILAGLADFIASHRPLKGRVLLLFQPAEETGQGAAVMLKALTVKGYSADFSFALHNLPGYPLNTVIVRNGTFAAASRGMVIRLKGKTSHASEPEKGMSPVAVMARLMVDLPGLSSNGELKGYRDFVLLTLIYGNLGSPAFGTSPGEAVLMATLRAYQNEDMEELCARATELVRRHSDAAAMGCEISFAEEFPATVNHPEAVLHVRDAAGSLGLPLIEAGLPFRWSEDFAHFALESKAALFGIGAGTDHPPLHHPDYDFPDAVIPTGLELWKSIYMKLLG